MQMTGDLFRGNRAFVIEKAPGVATAILRQSTVAPGQSLDRFNAHADPVEIVSLQKLAARPGSSLTAKRRK